MSADVQSAFRDEFGSSRRMTQTHPHQRSRFSQPRSNITFESPSRSSTEDSSISISETAIVPLNYPSIPTAIEEQTPHSTTTNTLHKLQDRFQHIIVDQITPLRLAGHLSVLGVAAIILVVSQINIPEWELPFAALSTNAIAQQTDTVNALSSAGLLSSELKEGSGNLKSLQRIALPFTTLPEEKTREIIDEYSVKTGDTVLGIAAQYNLEPETIMWANPAIESNPDRISVGDKLKVPPTNGVLHVVRQGDTLSSLASKYKVEVAAIVAYPFNHLEAISDSLTVGMELMVPGGEKPLVAQQVVAAYSGPVPASATKGSGAFAWPTGGNVTQGYWGGHAAIDIGSWTGAPVTVADSGYVVYVGRGWSSGYGNHIIIDHGNGYSTVYAHLNSIFVSVGENLGKGQQIATVGNTGNSTGPHLHFEIRYQGVRRNPYSFLP